jgi:hypothetical protein
VGEFSNPPSENRKGVGNLRPCMTMEGFLCISMQARNGGMRPGDNAGG